MNVKVNVDVNDRVVFPWTAAALILVGTLALYAHSTSGAFVWDDAVQISENPAVTRGASPAAYFFDRTTTSSRPDYNTRIYRPLRNVAFRLTALVAGVDPRPFRVANLLLYALCTPLVLALALKLGAAREAAIWATALWAALPVHVEAVCYASALGDLLSLLLQLGSVICGLAFLHKPTRSPALTVVASVVLAFAAMLAKEMAITTVALVALVAFVSRQRTRATWVLLLGHSVAAGVYFALRTWVVRRVGQDDATAEALWTGLTKTPVLLLEYARLVVAPLGHRPAYVVAPTTLTWALSCALAVALIVVLARVVDRKATPTPPLLVGLGWFALALTPVLNLVPLWADMADRFALAPSVGIVLIASASLHHLSRKCRRITPLFAAPLLVLYVAGTLVEQLPWKNDLTLWSHAAQHAPDSSLAQQNLGITLLGHARNDAALRALDRAVALGRDGPEMQLRRATALDGLERPQEALAAVEGAIRLDPTRGPAYALEADLLRRRGDETGARAALARALALAPQHPSTLLSAAALAQSDGRSTEAAMFYAHVAQLAPTVARFQYLAARSALAAGDPRSAAAAASACLRLTPNETACASLLATASAQLPRK